MSDTKTTINFTLEADGFVGLRQANAAAQECARWLRTVLPYDVRFINAGTESDLGGAEPNAINMPDGTAMRANMPRQTPPMGEKAPANQHNPIPEAPADAPDSDYYGMTVDQLRALAGERELEGRASMRTKAQLIAGLEAADAAESVPA